MTTQFNPAQLQTLKAAIAAETDPTFANARTLGDASGMRDFYNQAYSPAFQVWRSSTPASEVFGAVTWKSMTPVDAPDGTTAFTNRALACQNFQFNLQILLQGQAAISTGKLNIRQGLQDALSTVPSGVGGATQDAGWAGAGKVKLTIQRPVTRAEKLWATGTGTTAVPGDLGSFEGMVTADDISAALAA